MCDAMATAALLAQTWIIETGDRGGLFDGDAIYTELTSMSASEDTLVQSHFLANLDSVSPAQIRMLARSSSINQLPIGFGSRSPMATAKYGRR